MKFGIWHHFPEYESMYASSYGRIVLSDGVIRDGHLNGKYLTIVINDINSTRRYTLTVSRVIAASFFGRNDDLIVNHKDGNTINNKLDNLEYATQQYNVIHAYNTGLNKHVRRIRQFDLQGNFIKEYPSIAQAGRDNNCRASSISNVLGISGRTYKNYVWLYAN